MRALVYPPHGYITDSLIKQLKGSGHEVLCCTEGVDQDPDAWAAALRQASAVFHVLHGQQQHAKETLLQLLQTASAEGSVTFIGISTPLTWAATPAPAHVAPAQAASAQGAPAGQAAGVGSDLTASAQAAVPELQLSPVDAASTAGSAEPGTSTAGHFTAEDAPRRRPAGSAVDTFHLEQLVLRSNRPGRLHTHVVCPGVLYGAGEADDQLHGLWKTAWEGQRPLQVYGSGANRLPTLHVHDLASFCEAVALQQEEQLQEQQQQQRLQQQGLLPQQQHHPQPGRYWLAADSVVVTQQQLVEAVGRLLVCSQHRSDVGSLLDAPLSPLQLLDLPFSATPLARPPSRCCPQGLLGHLPQVLQELLPARNLSPLRILIRGPPAAGKTHLGMRLAQLYGLLHVNTAIILAELQHMDPETQKVATSQLSGREGRISPQLMARLAQHLLLRHPLALKQGWVLEGWPRSLSAAMLVTSVGAAGSAGSGSSSSSGGAASEAGVRDKGGKRDGMGSAGAKERRRTMATSSGGAGSPAGGGCKGGRRTAGEEDLLVHEGLALQSPDLMPHVLIELDVGDEELQRRVKALAAGEAAAAAAAAAAEAAAAKAGSNSTTSNGSSTKKPAGQRPSVMGGAAALTAAAGAAAAAGGGAGVVPAGPLAAAHNNLKDWGRRMEAYRQLLQEDASDLVAKRAAVIAAYQAQLAAEAAATGDGSDPQPTAGNKGSKQAGTGGGGGGSKVATPRHMSRLSMGEVQQQLPPDVKLPEHGGFAAYFVDAGANYIKASNTMDAAAAASAAPPSAAASVAPSPCQPGPGPHADATHAAAAAAALPPLESLEQQLAAEIGPPHNYTGLPEAFVRAAAAAAAAREAAGSGSEPTEATVAADGSAVDGRTVAAPVAVMAGAAAAQHHGGKAGVQQQLQKSGTRAARDAAALAAAEAALKGPGGLVEALRPDMEQLRVAAEALASEAAARSAHAVSAAARPLQSSLLDTLLPDLMAGLVEVALSRPEDPCQVIADKLLEAAAREKAAYTSPYDDPTYAVQLAKVEAKAAREEARAAAAAAKAAREQAAAAEANACAGPAQSEPAPPAAPDGNATAAADANSSGAAATGAKSTKQGSSEAAKAGQKGCRAAGSRASVAHGAQPAR